MSKAPGIYAPDGSFYMAFTTGMGLMSQSVSNKLQKGLYAPDSSFYACKTDGVGNLK